MRIEVVVFVCPGGDALGMGIPFVELARLHLHQHVKGWAASLRVVILLGQMVGIGGQRVRYSRP